MAAGVPGSKSKQMQPSNKQTIFTAHGVVDGLDGPQITTSRIRWRPRWEVLI